MTADGTTDRGAAGFPARVRPDLRFGDPEVTSPPWSEVEGLLRSADLYWLTSVRTDGRPHVTPLVGVWHEDGFVFSTGAGEQKQLNVAHDPRVAVTTGVSRWTEGTDVVVEGWARRITGRERLAGPAEAYRDKYGDDWAWQPAEDDFVAEGLRPWVYRVEPSKVLAFGKAPHSQTAYLAG